MTTSRSNFLAEFLDDAGIGFENLSRRARWAFGVSFMLVFAMVAGIVLMAAGAGNVPLLIAALTWLGWSVPVITLHTFDRL